MPYTTMTSCIQDLHLSSPIAGQPTEPPGSVGLVQIAACAGESEIVRMLLQHGAGVVCLKSFGAI